MNQKRKPFLLFLCINICLLLALITTNCISTFTIEMIPNKAIMEYEKTEMLNITDKTESNDKVSISNLSKQTFQKDIEKDEDDESVGEAAINALPICIGTIALAEFVMYIIYRSHKNKNYNSFIAENGLKVLHKDEIYVRTYKTVQENAYKENK